MKTFRSALILSGLGFAAGAPALDAQIGPILDWITRMSGPGVVRVGVQYSAALGGGQRAPAVSAAGLFGFKVRDGDGAQGDAGVNMLSLQTTLDVPIVFFSPDVALLGIVGIAGSRFSGDDFDNFNAISFPLKGAVRIRTGGPVSLLFGAGVNVFRFPSDAFAPIDVGVDQDAWEAAFTTNVAVLFRI